MIVNCKNKDLGPGGNNGHLSLLLFLGDGEYMDEKPMSILSNVRLRDLM